MSKMQSTIIRFTKTAYSITCLETCFVHMSCLYETNGWTIQLAQYGTPTWPFDHDVEV